MFATLSSSPVGSAGFRTNQNTAPAITTEPIAIKQSTPSRRGSMAYPFAHSASYSAANAADDQAGSPPTRTRTMSLYDVYAVQPDAKGVTPM